MISVSVMRLAIGLLLIVGMVLMSAASNAASPLVGSMKRIDGTDKDLSDYSGKVVLVVNVASQCGYTSQYAGLQKLYDTFKDKGFVILGFPANDFGAQEPGTDSEIASFCSKNYACSPLQLMQFFFLQTSPFDTSGILLPSLLLSGSVDSLQRLRSPQKKIFLFQPFLLFSVSYQQHKLQLLPSLGNMLFVVTEKPKPDPHLLFGKNLLLETKQDQCFETRTTRTTNVVS